MKQQSFFSSVSIWKDNEASELLFQSKRIKFEYQDDDSCKTLISVTSAGIIKPTKHNSKFVLIEQAIRDEGTSYHYMPPSETSYINPVLFDNLISYYNTTDLSIEVGKSWTTDAPYRETQTAIDEAKKLNVVCVEMEAAALYAFAKARNKNVICFAHLTNTMAQTEGDFEKGEEMGSLDTLELIHHTIKPLPKAAANIGIKSILQNNQMK